VTRLLAARNRLDVVLSAKAPSAGLTDEIALEVRRDAFLRDVAALWGPDGMVHVKGFVAGSCDGPLEIYILADGRNVHYCLVEASEGGTVFTASCAVDARPRMVQVELIRVAERWDAVEVVVSG
jgi:hypothetical protein